MNLAKQTEEGSIGKRDACCSSPTLLSTRLLPCSKACNCLTLRSCKVAQQLQGGKHGHKNWGLLVSLAHQSLHEDIDTLLHVLTLSYELRPGVQQLQQQCPCASVTA